MEKFVNEKITIKLPNDLLIKGSKVCGILQETVKYNDNKYFIVGIGINVINSPKINNKQVSFLQKYNNNKINKNDIYKNIKNNFEKFIWLGNMYLIGDIGNTETKICLFNNKKKLLKKKSLKI